MSKKEMIAALNTTVNNLTEGSTAKGMFHEHAAGIPYPSANELREVVSLIRSIIFPGYYGHATIGRDTLKYHIGLAVEQLHRTLSSQVLAGLCFMQCPQELEPADAMACHKTKAKKATTQLIQSLLALRDLLATDVEATFKGDPAAESISEVICCYPVIRALINYRTAHELHKMQIPVIPRLLTEMAHSETGIDIHPGAEIGHHFTIDHGTGTIIGATCIIGNNVKLYQGVTLGAKSVEPGKEEEARGIPRHPIIEDNVVIYSNTTIVGRVTIGHDSIIGANEWITTDVSPMSRIAI